jgi:hypothetical protein
MEWWFDSVGCLREKSILLSYMLNDVNAIVLRMLTVDIASQIVGLPSFNYLFDGAPGPRVCT